MKKIFTHKEMEEKVSAHVTYWVTRWQEQHNEASRCAARAAALERETINLLLEIDRLKQRMRTKRPSQRR